MARPVCYLDYNATTPLLPEVRAAVSACLESFGNPSSVHGEGRRARALVEDAREQVAAQVGTAPAEIVFTGGGTEANALALQGLAAAYGCGAVIAAGLEHASVLAYADTVIASDAVGRVDLAALEAALQAAPKPALVAVMLANNETGVIQPVAEAVALARRYGALVHCDAVQAFGKVPVDFNDLGVDTVSLSAHKVGGLKGAGALALRCGLDLAAQIRGGGQERRRRAGTENVVGIVSLGAAAREAPRLLADMPRVTALRDALIARVTAVVPDVSVHGAQAARLPNTICISTPNVSSETQVMRLDLAGIAISAGSACSSGKIAPSHVLLSMGVDAGIAKTTIRISLGWNTTADEIDRFIEAWRPLAVSAAA